MGVVFWFAKMAFTFARIFDKLGFIDLSAMFKEWADSMQSTTVESTSDEITTLGE